MTGTADATVDAEMEGLLGKLLYADPRGLDESAAAPDADRILPARPQIRLDPDRIEQDLAKLVLAIMALLRQLLENQALRRMERGTLTDAEVERVGLALMRAETQLHTLRRQFGLRPEDLNLDLGPLGLLFDPATFGPEDPALQPDGERQ